MASMLWNNQSALMYGAIGVVLVVLSNAMKRMIPLRMLTILSTIAFGLQAGEHRDWTALALQSCLFVINVYQLWNIRKTLIAIEQARVDAPVHDWLLPHMKKKKFKAGHVLWRKGDVADQLVYVERGSMLVEDNGHTLGPGSLIGEIGLFSMNRQRTATIVCQTNAVCHTMTDEAIHLLYFQNPDLGFYLIRLVVQRLLQDVTHARVGSSGPDEPVVTASA